MIYAYVKDQSTCYTAGTVVPCNSEINGKAISKHGDYSPWRIGKRETLRLMHADADMRNSSYIRFVAAAVAEYLGWVKAGKA
jgi:hypothetical protein